MDPIISITLIRHGKTPGNLRGSFVGSIDQPVAPEGVEELRRLAAQDRYPAVQLVLSSPMRRCIETACILYPDTATHTVADLRERCFGEFEDKTHAEIIAIPGFADWGRTESSMRFPGGEEFEPFMERIGASFWLTAERAVREGARELAIVTHGGVIMGILSAYAQPAREYFEWACGNGGGYTLECDIQARSVLVQSKL